MPRYTATIELTIYAMDTQEAQHLADETVMIINGHPIADELDVYAELQPWYVEENETTDPERP